MLHAPTSEAKTEATQSKSQLPPQPERELHPRLLSTAGLYSASGVSGVASGVSPEVRQRQTLAGMQSTHGNQAVLRMLHSPQQVARMTALRPSQGVMLQRKCACGGSSETEGECEECKAKHEGTLQRSAANPTVSPAAGVIQTKLAINQPGDEYEQEADRISEQVMRMPEPQLQRACACSGGCPKCQDEQPEHGHERLQAKRVQASDTGQISAPPIVHEILRSPGQPLDPATRTFMESRFGHDFSRVRVHTEPVAARSAKAVAAHAYTVGSDVVFASGRYAPASRDGQRLLAHELAHVVQQDRARAAGPLTIQDVSDPAERLSRGEMVAPDFGSGSAVLQRQSATSHSTGGPPGVAAEKYSEPLEEAYRRAGQTYRADAIQQCRLYGIELCKRILTEGEARAAYKLAKEGHSPQEAASQKAGPQPSVQRLARSPDGTAAAALPVFTGTGVGAAIGAGLEVTGAYVLAALPPLALAAIALLFVAALAEEIRFSRFVRILEEHGFITLLNPLGACIGACHAASTARAMPRTIPWPEETFHWPKPIPMTMEPARAVPFPESIDVARWDKPPPPASDKYKRGHKLCWPIYMACGEAYGSYRYPCLECLAMCADEGGQWPYWKCPMDGF